jgi:hypothetical protein
MAWCKTLNYYGMVQNTELLWHGAKHRIIMAWCKTLNAQSGLTLGAA